MLRISVDIPWKYNGIMSTEMAENPHGKSITFLRGICNSIDEIEFVESSSIYNITVRIRGRSGRHYEVVASRPVGLFMGVPWETEVTGAAWKSDFNTEKSRAYTAKLCLNIHEEKQHLPIGDRLASLALSLHNDIKLAMDIPLVAQFIVCPRNELLNVHIFQDEMIVTTDLLNDEFYDEEPSEFLDSDDEFDFLESIVNFWHSQDNEEPLGLESPDGNWARDLEHDIMRRYDRVND